MAATESAKAKFRSSSNPKSRGSTPEAPESPAPAAPKQRNSIGGGAGANVVAKAAESPGKTPVAFGTRKTTANAVQVLNSSSPGHPPSLTLAWDVLSHNKALFSRYRVHNVRINNSFFKECMWHILNKKNLTTYVVHPHKSCTQ